MTEWLIDPAARARFSDEKMTKVNLFESPNLFCDVYCLKPGQAQKVHSHVANDKIYHALSGSPHVTLGADTYPLPAGHTAIAPAGLPHGVENRSEQDCTLLVVMAPNPNQT